MNKSLLVAGVSLMCLHWLCGCGRNNPTPAAVNPKSATPLTFTEITLARIPAGVKVGEVKVSLDNRHFAYTLPYGHGWVVWRDGARSEPADEIKDLLFSPDSQHLAYVERHSTNAWVVLDGKREKAYEAIGPGCEVFSPDSQHLVYIARQPSNWVAVLDGREGRPYDRIAKVGITFSPDSRHLAYSAIRDKNCFWVVDGKECLTCDGMGPFAFSSDGRRTGYVSPKGEGWQVVVDEKAALCQRVLTDGVRFSPDGRHWLYAAGTTNLQVFVDGQGRETFDELAKGFFTFSPDSRRVIYGGLHGRQWQVVVDGKASPNYGVLLSGTLAISPDSQHVAYAIGHGRQYLVMLDEKPGAAYDGIIAGSLTFSPDSRHFGYLAGRGGKFMAVIDGKETEAYSGLGGQGLVFSPDSRRWAFVAQTGNDWQVVLNGKPGKPYQGIGLRPFEFSPDSLHFGFTALTAGKCVLVVDEQESKPCDEVLVNTGEGASFGAFHLLALQRGPAQDQAVVRVEANPAEAGL